MKKIGEKGIKSENQPKSWPKFSSFWAKNSQITVQLREKVLYLPPSSTTTTYNNKSFIINIIFYYFI